MQEQAHGIVRKMAARLEPTVAYALRLGEESVAANPLIGSPLRLEFSGSIFCVNCSRKTNKSFNQGFCYPCFQKLAACDSCIVHPERCHFDQGTCREPAWGEQFCMQDHIVYLANSSGLKVGITRATQVPTRWIDQGASQALPIFRVSSRLQSGAVEVVFKQHVADKTNWRELLKGDAAPLDMSAERERLVAACQDELAELRSVYGDFAINEINGVDTYSISYPVTEYLEKIVSHNFDKEPVVEGTLLGIKGQYLIFDTGVINLRRFSCYEVSASF